MGDQSSLTSDSNIKFKFDSPISPFLNIVSEDNMTFAVQDINQSLGILSSDLESSATFWSLSSRRKSLPCQDNQDSLGILSLDFEPKSVLYLENSDVGRESLGILQLDQLDVNLGYEISPATLLTPLSTNINNNELLDLGFFLTPKKSAGSEFISFNSQDLELPSKINSLQNSDNSVFSPTNSLLNNAKIMSGSHPEDKSNSDNYVFSPTNSLLNNAKIMSGSYSVDKSNMFSQYFGSDVKLQPKFFWSVARPTSSAKFMTVKHCNKLNFDEDKEDILTDSVFIEGNHLAQKIADGSFINDVPEHGILDCTPQPDWPDLDDSEMSSNECPKQNIETVLKTIDKLFPHHAQPVIDSKNKRSKSDTTTGVSKNPKEILQNLSQIFNCSHRSDKQKYEGRILINSLADLLNNSQTDKECNDSGHSSITENEVFEKDGNEYNEVLNVYKSIKSTANGSNLIEKENSFNVKKGPKQRSQSLDRAVEKPQKPIRKSLATGTNIQKVTPKDSPNVEIKLKPKSQNSRVKVGPVKAVIPVEDMKKTKKSISVNSSVKKTSTPINEPKLKPMATSTPDVTPKSTQRKSLPARINPNRKSKPSNNDGSKKADVLKSSKEKRTSLPKNPLNVTKLQGPFRRNSITEGMLEDQPKRTRSNSLGKETGMMSSLRKVRESLLKSPYYNKKTGILVDSNSKGDSKLEKRVNFSDGDLSMKLKKNKENVRP